MWKCIICDDEQLTRQGLTSLIQMMRNDIEVIDTAANGDEAIQKIKNSAPNIVLIDINMPMKNGLEVMQEIQKWNEAVRFIIISGYSDFEYAQKAIRLNAVDYLLKPIVPETLNEVLERCIHQITAHLNTSKIIVTDQLNQKIAIQIIDYIHGHFCESGCTLEDVASHFHLSSSYVSKLIKQEIQMTFTEVVNMKRIEHAKYLLLNNPHMLIIDVAEQCGFSSQHYFCRVFKNIVNISPNEYRNINS